MLENNKKIITIISLVIGQALTGSIISLITLSAVLVGNALSPNENLITLPVMSGVIGSALMVYFASNLMKIYGRKYAFIIGSLIGILGSVFAIFSIYYNEFYLFVFSTFIIGCATVFNQYYRFAGVEVFEDELKKKKSTSFIIGGGIFGGILGPFAAVVGSDMFFDYEFIGIFVLAIIIFLLAIISQLFIFIPKEVLDPNNIKNRNINTNHCIYSPSFIFSTLSCSLAFGLMILLMNAAPLSMNHHHFDIKDISHVLQWHFIAMYAPALFIPFFISKFKTIYLILIGALFFIIGSLISIYSNTLYSYTLSLISIGVGWSFMFTGGTFIINKISNTQIKHKIQGINSFITYLFSSISSLSVGFLISLNNGWMIINIISIIIILLFIICLLIFNKRLDF